MKSSQLINSLCIIILLGSLLAQSNQQSGMYSDYLVIGLDTITHYNQPWYSGLLNISNNNQIHFFFFPSQNNFTTDPLLLWLNGGPGCSSLLGATQENGPFLFLENSTEFELNPYSWNMNASVIYFESPPGVGFSMPNNPSFAWSDNTTAKINIEALLAWFKLFPQYVPNKFFIAGESYAGMYIPFLATEIDAYNIQQAQTMQQQINFIGIAVGNGCTDPLECGLNYQVDIFQVQVLYEQGFFPPSLWKQFLYNCSSQELLNSLNCTITYNTIMNFLGNSTQNNTANIYDLTGKCYYQTMNVTSTSNSKNNQQATNYAQMGQALWLHKPRVASITDMNQAIGKIVPVPGLPPCTDGIGPYEFFNNKTIQEALHVVVGTQWFMCNNPLNDIYVRTPSGSYPLYPNLIKQGYRIWIYSGAVDAAVPTSGTLQWLQKLKLQLGLEDLVKWRGWYQRGDDGNTDNRQNAGEFWQMTGITVVIFQRVGHMVPQYDKIGAQEMIQAFLNNQVLPFR